MTYEEQIEALQKRVEALENGRLIAFPGAPDGTRERLAFILRTVSAYTRVSPSLIQGRRGSNEIVTARSLVIYFAEKEKIDRLQITTLLGIDRTCPHHAIKRINNRLETGDRKLLYDIRYLTHELNKTGRATAPQATKTPPC